MGGLGSGRRPGERPRRKTQDALPLDVRHLARAGALSPDAEFIWEWSSGGGVRASAVVRAGVDNVAIAFQDLRQGVTREVNSQRVRIERTTGPVGGARPWFLCPDCERRVAIIYGAGLWFSCRTCKGLVYASQGQNAGMRATRRAHRLQRAMGWPAGLFAEPGEKPRGMHWRTYWRIRAELAALIGESTEHAQDRLKMANRALARLQDNIAIVGR